MPNKEEWKEKIKSRSDDEKKMIRIYTIELLVFSVIFLALGILELLGIIGNNMTWRTIFTYITLAGAAFYVGFTIFSLVNKKRRAKGSNFDRFIVIPAPIAVVVLDIITLIQGPEAVDLLHRIIIGIVFIYFSLAYIAQAIYHYFYPLPLVEETVSKMNEEDEKEAREEGEIKEEAKDEKSGFETEEKEGEGK